MDDGALCYVDVENTKFGDPNQILSRALPGSLLVKRWSLSRLNGSSNDKTTYPKSLFMLRSATGQHWNGSKGFRKEQGDPEPQFEGLHKPSARQFTGNKKDGARESRSRLCGHSPKSALPGKVGDLNRSIMTIIQVIRNLNAVLRKHFLFEVRRCHLVFLLCDARKGYLLLQSSVLHADLLSKAW
ncbi:hypothetical protein MAR_029562 [Mya arenaria]|uniref:Uncharacterized protein n=1 Tax=Mya arenaria TaxID=6604 RepID=A0ABY7DJJ3_MYAAR|nr:hypothetical protein MAR_029562 [Mya arenaria]